MNIGQRPLKYSKSSAFPTVTVFTLADLKVKVSFYESIRLGLTLFRARLE